MKDKGLGIDLERNRIKLFKMYKTLHGNKDARRNRSFHYQKKPGRSYGRNNRTKAKWDKEQLLIFFLISIKVAKLNHL